jgi:hypothetical protein
MTGLKQDKDTFMPIMEMGFAAVAIAKTIQLLTT